jgi:hypothetical protein
MQGISGMSGTGPVGPSGATGISGLSGLQGEQGIQGGQGDQGDQGIQGGQGTSGIGVTGVSGSGTGVSFFLSGGGVLGPVNIQGPSGATGISGLSGMQGEQGTQGVQGDQGDQGDQGIRGPSGATGNSGATGAIGAIGPHVTGVSGSGTGVSFFVSGGGILGPINIQGPSGATGISGVSGLKGSTGPQGDQGDQGIQGSQGDQGDQGLVGGDTFNFYFSTDTTDADPTNGYLKFGNSTYPSITEIYVDDMEKGGDSITDWVDSLDDVYQSRIKVFSASDAEKWAVFKVVSDNTAKVGYTQINVNYIGHSDSFTAAEEVAMTFAPAAQGPKGDTGPVGSQGAQGDDGAQGERGSSGIGITGISGSGTGVSFLLSGGGTLGPINIQGPSGLSGVSGISGMSGLKGDQGIQGIQGDQGDQGDQGIQGLIGATGVTGASITGATGATGASITGVTGSGTGAFFQLNNGTEIGPINIQGPSGATGAIGAEGNQGDKGDQGAQGNQGSQGTQGDQGIRGLVGGDTFNFLWRTDTSVSDPGNGYIKFDDAIYPDVQKICIDNLEKGGDSITEWVDTLDHVTGSRLKIFNTSDAEKWAVFRIAQPNTAGAGFTQLNVNYLAHSDSFTNLEEVSVTYAPAASGAPGGSGATGPSGADGVAVSGQFGGDSQMFYFNSGYANSGTTGNYQDPGTGCLGFSQAPHNRVLPSGIDYLKVTGIHVDDVQIDGVDISGWVSSFDDDADGDIKGRLRIYSATGHAQFVVYKITGSIIHHSGDPGGTGNSVTGFSKIPVTGVSSGMAYTGYTGAFFSGEPIIMSYTQVGQRGPAGPVGADSTVEGPSGASGTGPSGATGDFGGDSFSFYFNSGFLDTGGPGDSGVKLVSPNGEITNVTGIDISYINYKGGNVQFWSPDFGNYGDVSNRGILKLFRRNSVNEYWSSFTITGNTASQNDGYRYWENVPVTVRSSSQLSIRHHDGGIFKHSGETVVSFVPAGPTGADGVGGGAGGTPATGYSGAFQFHARGIVIEEGGDPIGPGALSGSLALFEGFDYDSGTATFSQAGKIGIGYGFGSSAWDLTGMSGTLDVRGDLWAAGNIKSHGSGEYDIGYRGEQDIDGIWQNADWWRSLYVDYGYINQVEARMILVTGGGGPLYDDHTPNVTVGIFDADTLEAGNGEIVAPTGYFDTIGSFQEKMGMLPLDDQFDHGVYLHENCLHFSPKWSAGASLGTMDLYWDSLYLSNNSLIMSGAGMTGAVHIGFDNDHNIRISQPKTGNEVTTSGTFVTGYSPNTVAELRLSGEGAGTTTLKATSVGTIAILGEGEGQTTLSNSGITSPSGDFLSGLSLSNSNLGSYFDVHDDGTQGDMTYCGQFNQCVEDLGVYRGTGWAPDPYGIGEGGSSFKINMAGSPLKKFTLSSHAHGLSLINVKVGRSVTIQVSALDDDALGESYFRFLSGNSLNFLGIEPHTLKVGKVGMLTITAYGTGESSCVCHWAETDYVLD